MKKPLSKNKRISRKFTALQELFRNLNFLKDVKEIRNYLGLDKEGNLPQKPLKYFVKSHYKNKNIKKEEQNIGVAVDFLMEKYKLHHLDCFENVLLFLENMNLDFSSLANSHFEEIKLLDNAELERKLDKYELHEREAMEKRLPMILRFSAEATTTELKEFITNARNAKEIRQRQAKYKNEKLNPNKQIDFDEQYIKDIIFENIDLKSTELSRMIKLGLGKNISYDAINIIKSKLRKERSRSLS